MTAETITREDFAEIRAAGIMQARHVLVTGHGDRFDLILDMAEAHLDEPARLAAARAKGVREGIEMAARAAVPFDAHRAPVAPDWPTRCAALEADGIAARKRVTALEAENAKLRERNAALEDGLWPLAKIGGEIDQYAPQLHDDDGTSVAIGLLRRARALLQGQGGAS